MPDCVLDYHIFRLDALVGIHVTSHNGPVDQERIKLFQGSPIVFFPVYRAFRELHNVRKLMTTPPLFLNDISLISINASNRRKNVLDQLKQTSQNVNLCMRGSQICQVA